MKSLHHRTLLLAAAVVLTTSCASAQLMSGNGYAVPYGAAGHPNGMAGPPSGAYGSMMPASWGAPTINPHHSPVPVWMPPHAGAQHGSRGVREVINTRVYKPARNWDDSDPIEAFVRAVARQSTFRVDYMLWNLEEPGRVTMGARVNDPITDDPIDPSVPFAVTDVGGTARGDSFVPHMDDFTMNSISGVRGTLLVPLRTGEFEMNFWGLDRGRDQIILSDLQAGRPTSTDPTQDPPQEAIGIIDPNVLPPIFSPNVATTLLLNGNPGNTNNANVLVYDERFEASLTSRMWGTELNLLQDSAVPWQGLRWQPLLGFRFVNLRETFTQQGVFNNGRTLSVPPPVTDPTAAPTTEAISRIVSRTVNNFYGPQIGTRLTLDHPNLQLTATPRIMLGLNDYVAVADSSIELASTSTMTDTLARFEDREREERIDFTPIFQVSFEARFRCNDIFSLFAGYDFMYIHRATRPYNNLFYDSRLNPDPDTIADRLFVPDIGLKPDLADLGVHGLTVGFEIRPK